jgi:hypothetical protein
MCKLKDDGKPAFRVDCLAKWSGFGVVDDTGDGFEIRAEDIALEHVDDPGPKGADYTHVLDDPSHRSTILKIAAEKCDRGFVEPGNIIRVTYADVATLTEKPSNA